MSEQPEALRLAEWLDHHGERHSHGDAAAELRRLHSENEALKEALKEAEALDTDANALAVASGALADSMNALLTRCAEMEGALRNIVEFVDMPVEGKRPDVFVRRIDKARAVLVQIELKPCVHINNPKGCYRIRCQLGNKCVEDA